MKKMITLFLCGALLCAVASASLASASAVDVTAKSAILTSADGRVLFEKNADEKRPIASMTKIMTLNCIYDAVAEGKISLQDEVVVSRRAASMGGSQVFLEANGKYKAEDLVKSIIICSANDSCVAMAEHVCGSVEAFVRLMNQKAKDLQMRGTHFENCTGLPNVSQYSCARDVAAMLAELITHPHYFTCAKVWTEDFHHPGGRVTGMTNTNKLVRFYDGCDGGKTGFTNEAMHCLAATAKRGDTRVISVVVGASDSKTRFAETSRLFDYAFANYNNNVYLNCAEQVDVNVTGGRQSQVACRAKTNLAAFEEKGKRGCTLQWEIPESVKAPLSQGDVVGEVKLLDEQGDVIAQTEVVACCDVQAKSFWDYIKEIVG